LKMVRTPGGKTLFATHPVFSAAKIDKYFNYEKSAAC
jgi:hypothetical protein